jgi:hypothetical protein
MYKKYKTPSSSRFKFALENVGSYLPPHSSMFTEKKDEDEEEDGEDAVNSNEKQAEQHGEVVASEANILQKQQQLEEAEQKRKLEAKKDFLGQYGIKIIEEEEEQKKKDSEFQIVTKSSGRIQFSNIVIPPTAPKDLICEECEKKFASYYCQACRQIFCYTCGDLCHPRVSANDLMHEHESNGYIRALKLGDTSRVKVENDFYLPAHEVHPEEYEKIKDLAKPNTLVTNERTSEILVLNPARQLPANKPIYKVNNLVIYTDPTSSQRAYGRVITEYDPRHGTAATPAMIRGEESNLYYMVEKIDLLAHADDLETVLLTDGNYLLEKKKKDKQKEIDKNFDLIPELPYDHMKEIRNRVMKLNQRITEYNNLLLLGPKNHLRDLNFPKGIPFPLAGNNNNDTNLDGIQEKGEGSDDDTSQSSPQQRPGKSKAMEKYQKQVEKKLQLSKQNIRKYIHQLNKEENSSLGDSSMTSSLNSDSIGGGHAAHLNRHSVTHLDINQRVSLYHAQKQHNEASLEDEDDNSTDPGAHRSPRVPLQLHNIDPRKHIPSTLIDANVQRREKLFVSDEALLAPTDPLKDKRKANVDFNLYANVDQLDDETVLSYHNDHRRPLQAMHRSYEDYVIQSTFDSHKTSHYFPNRKVDQSLSEFEKEVRQKMLNIVVVAEKDIQCTLQDHLKELQAKKDQLLNGAFSRAELVYLKAQLIIKFIHWKKFVQNSRNADFFKASMVVQRGIRRWLCRVSFTSFNWNVVLYLFLNFV